MNKLNELVSGLEEFFATARFEYRWRKDHEGLVEKVQDDLKQLKKIAEKLKTEK